MTCRDREPDRAAPVLNHHRDFREVELQHELLKDRRVFARRVPVAGRGPRETESRVVRRDAAVAVSKPHDDVAV